MEARAFVERPEALEVVEVNDAAAFAALKEPWDSLVTRTRDEVFYRHEFIRTWISNFAPSTKLRVLTARHEGRLVAALPLVEERTTLYGIPVRQLSAAANAHSCRFDLLAEDPVAAAQVFLAHLKGTGGWDLIRITDVPEGGSAWHFHEAASAAGHPTGTWESLQSPYVPLPGSFEALQSTLQAKFKANVRRRRKKLEEKGTLTIERVTGGLGLDEKLEEGFRLEQSGWKGERGTAMAQDPKTRGFYAELARSMAYQDKLVLYFLRLDGRAIAFHFALAHGQRYLLLKPGYDEALKECSPGQLLVEEVLKDCISRGYTEFDFLGPNMTWKLDWTQSLRAHTWLFIFNDTAFGKALCNAKFKWVPAAKETLARWNK
jgi:CelD/BcsL family acetyltransferase involved in cellulose biosynthesis